MKLILVESQQLHRKMFWSFSDKVDRFRKFTILRPNFGNKLFLKLSLSKNVFDKSCYPKSIFNEKKLERFGQFLTFPCLVHKLLTALDYKQTALKNVVKNNNSRLILARIW